MVRRGEIWQVNLDPTVGSESKKSRSCVVILPAKLNAHLRTVTMAPMTSKGLAAPFRIPVTHAGIQGLIVLDQFGAVDQLCLTKTLAAVLVVLQEMFAG